MEVSSIFDCMMHYQTAGVVVVSLSLPLPSAHNSFMETTSYYTVHSFKVYNL